MHRSGHVGIGLLLFAPFALALARSNLDGALAVGLAGTLLASTLPDADEFLPGIDHRGPNHTVPAALVVGLCYAVAGAAIAPSVAPPGAVAGQQTRGLAAAVGFLIGFVGVLGHLAADVCTPMGIEPWRPLASGHYSLDLLPSKHRLANRALLALGSVAVLAAVAVGRTLRSGSIPPG